MQQGSLMLNPEPYAQNGKFCYQCRCLFFNYDPYPNHSSSVLVRTGTSAL